MKAIRRYLPLLLVVLLATGLLIGLDVLLDDGSSDPAAPPGDGPPEAANRLPADAATPGANGPGTPGSPGGLAEGSEDPVAGGERDATSRVRPADETPGDVASDGTPSSATAGESDAGEDGAPANGSEEDRVGIAGVVLDPGGAAVPGAAVAAELVGRDDPSRGRTRTDEAGRFAFPDLPSGLYVLHATDDENRLVREELGDPLEPGEEREVELVLRQGARVEGRVVTAGGRPIEGARVLGGTRSGRGRVRDWSGPDGSFVLEGLLPGEVLVRVHGATLRPGGSSGWRRRLAEARREAGVEWSGPESVADVPRERLAVGPGETGRVDLVVRTGRTLSGGIYLPEGRAAGEARVFALRDGEYVGRARADGNGRWTIEGLLPGDLLLYARTEDYGFLVREPMAIPEGSGPVHHDLTLRAEGTVAGRVLAPDGSPVEGVEVDVWSSGTRDVHRETRPGPDGAYRVGGLYPGTYRVRARGEGGRESPVRTVEVEAGEDRAGLELSLRSPAAVSGTLRMPDGRPAAGVWVFLYRGGRQVHQTHADEEGVFRFEDVRAGTWDVYARTEAFDALWRRKGVPLEPGGSRSDLEGVLVEPSRVDGRVVDGAGRELPRVGVRARSEPDGDVRREDTADEAGRFGIDRLYPGTYDLTVRVEDRRGRATVTVPSGGSTVEATVVVAPDE